MPVGIVAVSWVAFIIVLLLFPPSQATSAQGMSEYRRRWCECLGADVHRLRCRDYHERIHLCINFVGGICAQMVPWTDQEHRHR
jgi:hypothetical protein